VIHPGGTLQRELQRQREPTAGRLRRKPWSAKKILEKSRSGSVDERIGRRYLSGSSLASTRAMSVWT